MKIIVEKEDLVALIIAVIALALALIIKIPWG